MAGRIPPVRADIDTSAVRHRLAIAPHDRRLLMLRAEDGIPSVNDPFAANRVEKISRVSVFRDHATDGRRVETGSHRLPNKRMRSQAAAGGCSKQVIEPAGAGRRRPAPGFEVLRDVQSPGREVEEIAHPGSGQIVVQGAHHLFAVDESPDQVF